MSIPTQEGWYWCFDKMYGGMRCTHVRPEGGHGGGPATGHFVTTTDRGLLRVEDTLLEWGPRSPSTDRLKAMEEVAAASPWEALDHKGNICVCRHCGVVWRTDDSDEQPAHKSTCPWPMAQDKE